MNTEKQGIKVWWAAVRPFAYTASVLTVMLGGALAFYAGHTINWPLWIITLLGVVCFHTCANLLNDCFDHKRGLDTEVLPMSGAVVRGWLTETQVFRAAALCLALGTLCGIILAFYAGWVVVLLGILGGVCALGYTTPRFCFKYAALGDPAIFIAFGVLPVFGTWWVQTRTFSWLPILWSLPLVLPTIGILHGNNWRDIESDGKHNCKTVASLLGPTGSRFYYRFLVLGPFALVLILTALGQIGGLNIQAPLAVLITLLALPHAIKLSLIRPETDPDNFVMLDGKTAQLHLSFGILCTAAFVTAGLMT